MADIRDIANSGSYYQFVVGTEDPGYLYFAYQNVQAVSNETDIVEAIYTVLNNATALPVIVNHFEETETDATPE